MTTPPGAAAVESAARPPSAESGRGGVGPSLHDVRARATTSAHALRARKTVFTMGFGEWEAAARATDGFAAGGRRGGSDRATRRRTYAPNVSAQRLARRATASIT